MIERRVDGRAKGPVRADCEVVSRSRDGAYLTLTVAAPEIARGAHPGQFVNVAVSAPETLLRRPFSISEANAHGGTVDFVLDPHGPGTRWLGDRDTGDVLDVVGPLGTSFRLPERDGGCLLVGGGYGAAPLFYLADRLRSAAHRVDMILGAASEERLFNAMEAKRISTSVTFTTDDGSRGTEGVVTDVFDDVAEHTHAGTVYACGPMPMLQAVATAAAIRGLTAQLAVEEHMACGVGVCWTCVVPIESADGEIHMRRSCLDGPVFDGDAIAWWHSRWSARPDRGEFRPSRAASGFAGPRP